MKSIWRFTSSLAVAGLVALSSGAAMAQTEYKIPALADFSGPFADLTKHLVARDLQRHSRNDQQAQNQGIQTRGRERGSGRQVGVSEAGDGWSGHGHGLRMRCNTGARIWSTTTTAETIHFCVQALARSLALPNSARSDFSCLSCSRILYPCVASCDMFTKRTVWVTGQFLTCSLRLQFG